MNLYRAYSVLKRWYRHASARSPDPFWDNIDNVTKDYTTLYQMGHPEPPGKPLATHVDPFQIND